MNVEIKDIDDELFEIYRGWLASHSWPDAPRPLFPEIGKMAFFDDVPVIAGWVYRDKSSALSMMEYVVKNPEVHKDIVKVGFNALVDALANASRETGAKLMNMVVEEKRTGFRERLKSVGFSENESGLVSYSKFL